jgi:CRP-like cAMP-binding protein
MHHHPGVSMILFSHLEDQCLLYSERIMIALEREQFLKRLALFSDLDAGELGELAEVAQVVQFPASALIFREGEAGDCAYVVVRGSAQVFAIDRVSLLEASRKQLLCDRSPLY